MILLAKRSQLSLDSSQFLVQGLIARLYLGDTVAVKLYTGLILLYLQFSAVNFKILVGEVALEVGFIPFDALDMLFVHFNAMDFKVLKFEFTLSLGL
jgi:hypothetical protein